MKMMYGGTPIKNLHIVKHDVSTDDATVLASDLQSGVTAYARGQKITGTGKCFSFAWYGMMETNDTWYIPTDINVVEIASTLYPIRLTIELSALKNVNLSKATVAVASINGNEYNIDVVSTGNSFTLECDETIQLEVFYGKDEYV